MAKSSKRMRAMAEQVEDRTYTLSEALGVLKNAPKLKFVESVDVAIRLGVDPRKSEHVVRGATLLPHGTGATVRVAVFAQGPAAEQAEAAGADRVGMEDLAELVKSGKFDCDVVIATPDAMPAVGKLGTILGPRGLMPNPKVGTVTTDVATAVKNVKAGQVRYRTDKGGIIHCLVGKLDFSVDALKENIQALLVDLNKLRPATAKSQYVRGIAVSSTMGLGIRVDQTSV